MDKQKKSKDLNDMYNNITSSISYEIERRLNTIQEYNKIQEEEDGEKIDLTD